MNLYTSAMGERGTVFDSSMLSVLLTMGTFPQ